MRWADGKSGASRYTGAVTIVFGDINGGGVDFAIALLNRNGITASDFYDSGDAAALGSTSNLSAINVAGTDFAIMQINTDLLF